MTVQNTARSADWTKGLSKRAAAKVDQILDGARHVFTENGYEGASIDEIARVARVSKPTLYRYFEDKRHLYSAVFTRECELYAVEMFPREIEAADVREALTRVGQLYLDRLFSPQAQSAFRLAVENTALFPDLARAFHATGPQRGAKHLERILSNYVTQGKLTIDDVPLAAAQFLELCKADQFYKVTFRVTDAPDPDAVGAVIDGAVNVFLRAYGANTASSG